MFRSHLQYLQYWLKKSERLPLVIRGARQVGKTWLVNHLAKIEDREIIEINFESHKNYIDFFASNDPKDIILKINNALNITIKPEINILFLDEIQVYPELLAKLRWFAEKMPELPVIAAGSLLEFVLEEHNISMPVGRISFMYLEPLSFEEFLLAANKQQIINYYKTFRWDGSPFDSFLHDLLMRDFKEYLFVGGMPKAVSSWVKYRSFMEIDEIHNSLISTYRSDFAKYGGRLAIKRLDDVMMAVPKNVGEKFVYTKVDPNATIESIKNALALLCKAHVCHCIQATSANGLPLGAEIQERYLKVIFIDVGLCSIALGLTLNKITFASDITLINKGGIAEQVAGQLLRTITPAYVEPNLYYWQKSGSEAELDYVIQHTNLIVPIEVKAGKTGRLRSLHVFMGLKKFPIAVRINSILPQKSQVKIKDAAGKDFEYTLLSIPFYLIGELPRLLDEALEAL